MHPDDHLTPPDPDESQAVKPLAVVGEVGGHTSSDGMHTISDGMHSNSDSVHTNSDSVHTNSDSVHTNSDSVHTNSDGMHTTLKLEDYDNNEPPEGVHVTADGMHALSVGMHTNLSIEDNQNGPSADASTMTTPANGVHTASLPPAPPLESPETQSPRDRTPLETVVAHLQRQNLELRITNHALEERLIKYTLNNTNVAAQAGRIFSMFSSNSTNNGDPAEEARRQSVQLAEMVEQLQVEKKQFLLHAEAMRQRLSQVSSDLESTRRSKSSAEVSTANEVIKDQEENLMKLRETVEIQSQQLADRSLQWRAAVSRSSEAEENCAKLAQRVEELSDERERLVESVEETSAAAAAVYGLQCTLQDLHQDSQDKNKQIESLQQIIDTLESRVPNRNVVDAAVGVGYLLVDDTTQVQSQTIGCGMQTELLEGDDSDFGVPTTPDPVLVEIESGPTIARLKAQVSQLQAALRSSREKKSEEGKMINKLEAHNNSLQSALSNKDTIIGHLLSQAAQNIDVPKAANWKIFKRGPSNEELRSLLESVTLEAARLRADLHTLGRDLASRPAKPDA